MNINSDLLFFKASIAALHQEGWPLPRSATKTWAVEGGHHKLQLALSSVEPVMTWHKYDPPALAISVTGKYPLGRTLRQLVHIVPENFQFRLPDLILVAEDGEGRKWVLNHPFPETLSLGILTGMVSASYPETWGRAQKIEVLSPLSAFRSSNGGKLCILSRPASGRYAKKWQISDLEELRSDEYLALLGELSELSAEYNFFDAELRESEQSFMAFVHSVRKQPIYRFLVFNESEEESYSAEEEQ